MSLRSYSLLISSQNLKDNRILYGIDTLCIPHPYMPFFFFLLLYSFFKDFRIIKLFIYLLNCFYDYLYPFFLMPIQTVSYLEDFFI